MKKARGSPQAFSDTFVFSLHATALPSRRFLQMVMMMYVM
jgi:hypothetical protein